MVDGKWIEGLGPLLTVAEAARISLQARLEVVRFYLPLAMHEADRDIEHVHRLRVGTRRAGAVLLLFGSTLPDKLERRLKKALRGIRRSAGEARDWDVFRLELLTRSSGAADKDRPGLEWLIGYASGQRDGAQQHLVEAGTRHGDALKELMSEAIAQIQEREGAPAPRRLPELGQTLLRDWLQELTWAARRNLDDYAHLHQVRILGKQLRYAMEIFASCFPTEFRESLYPQIEEMQEILGLANDSHVAVGRLELLRERCRGMFPEAWKRWQPGVEHLLRLHRRRLPRERERFLLWWKRWEESAAPRLREMLQMTEANQTAPAGQSAAVPLSPVNE